MSFRAALGERLGWLFGTRLRWARPSGVSSRCARLRVGCVLALRLSPGCSLVVLGLFDCFDALTRLLLVAMEAERIKPANSRGRSFSPRTC